VRSDHEERAQRHRDTETRRHADMQTCRQADTQARRQAMQTRARTRTHGQNRKWAPL